MPADWGNHEGCFYTNLKRITMSKEIIVIGCGVAGLTSALQLLEAGHSVTIWAKDLPPATTSNIAAAIWYPYKAAPEEKVVEWSKRGYEVFCELVGQPDAGVAMRTGIEFFHEPTNAPAWSEYVQNFRHARPDELLPGYADAHLFDAPMIEMNIFLPFLMKKVREAGGEIVRREIKNIAEAASESEIVVNCTGLGSRALLNDTELFPIRGQIMRVPRGEVNFYYFAEEENGTLPTYIVPRTDDCILGGVAQVGNWSLEYDPATAQNIQERCARLQPSLQNAPVLEHLVGLRPGRSAIRLEAETLPGGQTVIHNYGHGGAGVTVSWGCAEGVVQSL
jgi:D-amino-acid oxidase